jgi:hypothetical protein
MGTDWTKSRGGGRDARRKADTELFSSFKACLPPSGCMAFLDRHHMGASFRPEQLAEIRRFCACWQIRGHEFHDRCLERLRRALLRRGEEYLRVVDQLTEVGPDGLRTVPRILLHEDPAKFDAAVYRLNRLADRVVRSYARMRRAAKVRLSPGSAD